MKRSQSIWLLYLSAWFMLAPVGNVLHAQEPAWWTSLKSKCGLSPSLAYNDWVAEGTPCNKGQSATPTSPATSGIGQAFVNGFQRGLANAQIQQTNMLNSIRNADAATDDLNAAKARTDEQNEDAIMAADLARHQAEAAGKTTPSSDFQSRYNSANQLLGGGLPTALALNAGSTQDGASQQKAWRQLHCMAYLSQFAFEDLALGDIADYHDIRYDASKAADGSSTGRSCPAAPDFPHLSQQSRPQIDAATQRLKSDLDRADQIAARLQQANYQPPASSLPAADNPQMAALLQQQRALSAVQSAKNPYSDPAKFAQFEKDRQTIATDIQDSSKIQKEDFGSIHVNLGSVPVPASPVPAPMQ